MRRLIMGLWAVFVLSLVGALALGLWARFELLTPDTVSEESRLEIAPGTSYQGALGQLIDAGRLSRREALWLRIEARLVGAPEVKAGEYRLAPEQSPYQLRDLLVGGDVLLHRIQIVEGWTTQQAVAAVRRDPAIVQELTEEDLALNRLMAALGLEGESAEGRFKPDTYAFPKGTTDRAFLRRAALAQTAELERWWSQRADDLPLDNPDELLILASIIEKETGLSEERFEVAGVFINRLRRGMRLQTDPTVAYGVAADFSGRLLRKHLDTDTPFNTYTRDGLPPTAICLPGSASLQAAVEPAVTDKLFFVARGDGSGGHVFSKTLAEHNAAVQRYREAIRAQRLPPPTPAAEPAVTPIPDDAPVAAPADLPADTPEADLE
ncbi:endolytic transglycosylase MltG [Polycyclovorans algicola]|uniref:endolytic transglycosylase MltG n=1 Tax=Polycyclovorans algicola TaxID=616992 RepID=UPI0009FBBB2C|nr:endolytic transglycosylase MltG [Polycyclovorans algicola]